MKERKFPKKEILTQFPKKTRVKSKNIEIRG